jgi:hypothetical protein
MVFHIYEVNSTSVFGVFLLNEYQSKTYIIYLYDDIIEFIVFQTKFKYLTFHEFKYLASPIKRLQILER